MTPGTIITGCLARTPCATRFRPTENESEVKVSRSPLYIYVNYRTGIRDPLKLKKTYYQIPGILDNIRW
jgi:hypothetical protein